MVGPGFPAESSGVTCPRCGISFACRPDGPCWCREQEFTLPRAALAPEVGCYCPRCLVEIAKEASRAGGRVD